MSEYKNLLIAAGIAVGLVLLAFASGAYWQFERMKHAPARTQLYYIEHPTVIPPVTQHQHAHPAQNAEDHQAAVDSLMARAERADSLDAVLRDKLQVMAASFEDSLVVSDTLGTFRTQILTEIEYDPVLEIMTKIVTYVDPSFKSLVIDRSQFVELTIWEKLYYALPVAAVLAIILHWLL